ncbi:MAG: tRNA pseudouridine(55) synthase TruB [candidate division WOR-3 bacterium]|nr:tRNA pseudouridine(55) synthase TruB [candidate division WOR-3 bacterium]MCX7837125.1 tRNA pseudouridine(55) synthase TruB [candidate division WOR-3 bacterium]MDW8113666.1 tRNA pseudouridine(55) synthase TruB [candidate division WOR-3 bacterium]
MRGIVLVNKEVGLSSYDLIRIVKNQIVEDFKIGHSGTLDPLACGVVILLFNEATKISNFLMDYEKEYIGVIKLGIETDTDDITGKVIAKKKVPKLKREEVLEILKDFVGKIIQEPPVYSAIKINGEPSYLRARKNKEVVVKERLVECYQIELIDYFRDTLLIKAVVGRGFYLRSLARDIGRKIGCGGTLAGLKRIRIGKWQIEDCLNLWELSLENIKKNLISIRDALYSFREYFYNKKKIEEFKREKRIFCEDDNSGYCKIISEDEKILIIGEKEDKFIKFLRLIYEDN